MPEIPKDILERIDLRKLYPDKWGLPLMVHCPEHGDTGKPNLGVYPRNVYCFHPSCNFHEGAFSYIGRVKGLKSTKDILAEALALCGDTARPDASTETPIPIDKAVAREYFKRLRSYPKGTDWLREKYGLTGETIYRAGIGYTGKNPFAFTIPVFDVGKNLVTIRFRADPLRGDSELKYWGTRGHNQATFYLPPSLTAGASNLREAIAGGEVFLTEGEFDALALYQIGFQAISATNGARALIGAHQHLLSELQGVRVFVAYDQDEVGREHSSKLTELLHERGCEAYNLQWNPELGKDASEVLSKGGNGDLFWKLANKALTKA